MTLTRSGWNVCSGTADALKTESGFTLESNVVTDFRNGVLEGQWDSVEKLLLELPEDQVANMTVRRLLS